MAARKLDTATGAHFWAQVLLIAGVLFIIAFLFVKAHPRRVPETAEARIVRAFHRGELARQRDLLRTVPLWYLSAFVPTFVASTVAGWESLGAGALVGLPVVAVIVGLVWALNKAGAKFLDGQVQAVDALPLADTE